MVAFVVLEVKADDLIPRLVFPDYFSCFFVFALTSDRCDGSGMSATRWTLASYKWSYTPPKNEDSP